MLTIIFYRLMSTMSKPVLLNVLASCVNIADKACGVVREIMASGDLGIIDKGGQKNLQTKADRTCEQVIVASLLAQYPKLTVIGEEKEPLDPSKDAKAGMSQEVLSKQCPPEYANVTEDQIVVWVDPLDGTAEFTEGLLDHVTCLIGIAVDGKAVAGTISQPFHNYDKEEFKATKGEARTIWGMLGLGAFGWKRVEPPADRRILITSRSHSNPLVTACVEALSPTSVERQGGAGNKVLQVMFGNADAYVFASKGCKKWDTCAPEAVLCAAGGELTDIHGDKMQYHATVNKQNLGGTIATFKDHKIIADLVPQHVKDALPVS